MNCKFCNKNLNPEIIAGEDPYHYKYHYCPDCKVSFNKGTLESMIVIIPPIMYNLHFNYTQKNTHISSGIYAGPMNPTPLTDVITIPIIKNITPRNAAKKLKLYMTFS